MKQKQLYILLLLVAGSLFYLSSCRKNQTGDAPSITRLRAATPAPNDSVLTLAGPGQTVVIQGANLRTATEVYFNGYPAPFNSGIISDNNIVVVIPADMPFASLDIEKLNSVRVVTTFGETTFTFPVIPPPPIINAMSNEYANPGEEITIFGNNLFFVEQVAFPGNIIVTTGITTNETGTELHVTVPAGITTAGHIEVKNRYGTGTSILLYNDFVSGVLHNYDNVSNFDWGAGNSNSSVNYPGNHGTYGVMKAAGIPAGDGSWWVDNRSINIKELTWVPTEDLEKPLDNFALKFEIYVTKAWSTGSIYIVKDYNWNYLAVYAPWKKPDGTVSAFTTTGWQTIVVPFTNFKTKANGIDGTGNAASSLKTFVGTGKGTLNIFFVNNGTKAVDVFEAALDNFRIVKIKE